MVTNKDDLTSYMMIGYFWLFVSISMTLSIAYNYTIIHKEYVQSSINMVESNLTYKQIRSRIPWDSSFSEIDEILVNLEK